MAIALWGTLAGMKNIAPGAKVWVSSPIVSCNFPYSKIPPCSWAWSWSGISAPASISKYESMSFSPCGVLRRQPGQISVAVMDLMSMNGMVSPARGLATDERIRGAWGVVVSEGFDSVFWKRDG